MTGCGGLACTIGVRGPQPAPRVELTVTASAGASTASATVVAETGLRLIASVDGSPTAEARLEADHWAFPPVEAYFVDSAGRPVRPPFGTTAPVLVATPAAVEASGPATSPDGGVWTIPVRACPGEIDALLRAGGGDVRVTVTVGDEHGRTHRATAEYLVRGECRLRLEPPSVELPLEGRARLEVSLVRFTGQGAAEPVPAALSVEPPRGTGVAIAPLRGRDLLSCELRIEDPETAVSFLLPVRAEPPGRPAIEGLASVVVELPYEVAIVRGPDRARAVGAWTVDPAGLVVPAVALDTASEPPRVEPLLAPRIAFELRGPNARLLELAPSAAGAQAQARVTFAPPAPGEAFEPGDPQLVASLRLGGRTREHAVTLSLTRCRQQVLEGAIRGIAADLAAQGHFVRNRLQGTPVLDGAYQVYGAAWGAFSGQATTCEGYVAASEAALLAAVRRCYGDEAGLEQMTIIERSTVVGSGLRDWCDAWYDDNHTLFRLTLPDGTQQAVDFWEHARKLIPDHPVVNDWQGVEAIWKRRLGADFDPAYSVTTHRVIQAAGARAVPAAVRS